jgi:hypothetical protein
LLRDTQHRRENVPIYVLTVVASIQRQTILERSTMMPTEDRSMWMEIAKPIALMLCMVSLFGVFHTAFLVPAADMQQRISTGLERLALAAAISLISGVIFREPASGASSGNGNSHVFATLPMRVFLWTTAAMLIFFVVSWYLESHCIFYRDVRVLY